MDGDDDVDKDENNDDDGVIDGGTDCDIDGRDDGEIVGVIVIVTSAGSDEREIPSAIDNTIMRDSVLMKSQEQE